MRWTDTISQVIAAEISRISRYMDRVIQWQPLAHDDGRLLELIDAPAKTMVEHLPDLRGERQRRTVILLNGNLNHDTDIQGLLARARDRMGRNARLLVVAYNPYLRWLYQLAARLRIRRAPLPATFLTIAEVYDLARLSNLEVVRVRTCCYSPFRLFGIGTLVNALLPAVPLLRWFAFGTVIVLRPVIPESGRPSLSIVIPARNEAGNIEDGLRRIPDFGASAVEVIYVEGHSEDDTWKEIQRVVADPRYAHLTPRAFQQPGKGKKDAVELGFREARNELITILDADLTMPPERLGRFYDAYVAGHADFVNGNRLLYPMEDQAMRFLNHLGNIFFAKALSWVLSVRLSDSLCGTKLLARHDLRRMQAWREDFGDFDPFGDFQLLFPAAQLALGTVDVPIPYRARSYGQTNISRFSHGWILFRMMLRGLRRIRLG